MFWYLEDSLSLSSKPFMLALFTIWTRMGVSSPSRASSPWKDTHTHTCTDGSLIHTGHKCLTGAFIFDVYMKAAIDERAYFKNFCMKIDLRPNLGKCRSCHLHTALIRGIDLEVMSKSALQPHETQARRVSIVTCQPNRINIHANTPAALTTSTNLHKYVPRV